MASYTVTGHPLNLNTTDITNPEQIRAALQIAGVGTTVNLTLSGPDDTKVKGHGALK